MFPKATHETFAQKMYQTYKSHKRFAKPKLSRTNFTINHYAGDVSKTLCHIIIHHLDPICYIGHEDEEGIYVFFSYWII